MNQKNNIVARVLPLLLSSVLVVCDQLSKVWVINNIPLNTIGMSFLGDFLRIIHVRNLGMAFSLGNNVSGMIRNIFLISLPIAVLLYLLYHIVFDKNIPNFVRWGLAVILGGGVGNMIDRVIRPLGVVDFIDIKFYGLFFLQRWPTFNVADSCVFVGMVLLGVYFMFFSKDKKDKWKHQ